MIDIGLRKYGKYQLKKGDKMDSKIIDAFAIRNASKLVRSDITDIIKEWIRWCDARFQVFDDNNGYYLCDMNDQEVVAFVSKKNPNAFNHIYNLRDSYNQDLDVIEVSSDSFSYANFFEKIFKDKEEGI